MNVLSVLISLTIVHSFVRFSQIILSTVYYTNVVLQYVDNVRAVYIQSYM